MKRFAVLFSLLLFVAAMLAGCGGGTTSSMSSNNQGAVFVTGEDAPLASVLAFNITLNSITLNNGSGSVAVLADATTVDFARLVGLRTPLAFNSVAAGTYTSATFQLSNPVISYLNIGTNPPTTSTVNGTLTTSTVTVSFPAPMVVSANGLAGLHMEFNLRQSLAVDGSGQITGSVDPHIKVQAVLASDEGGRITDLSGGLQSVNVSGNSFVIQRFDGRQITIDAGNQTRFNGSWGLGNLATPAFIAVEGTMQADGSVLADNVEVISTTHAFVSGRILAVNPATGPVQTITLFVGEELPAIASIPNDSVVTIDVSSVTNYDVCFFDNWFTSILFNNTELVVGQRVFVGGDYDGTTFTPELISLRRQGVVGALVQNSVQVTSGNRGDFGLQNSNLLGYVLGGALTVQTGDGTNFVDINGLAGLESAGSTNLAVGGLILKDQNTGNPQLWAHTVVVQQ